MEAKEKNEELTENEVLIEKIICGLDLAHKRLVESAKRNNEELVVLINNEIVRIKPQ
jgi:tartrate dehydratase beta subunit/fumarate hydratase class I family protein